MSIAPRLLLALLLTSACVPSARVSDRATAAEATPADELVALHERYRVDVIDQRRFTHEQLWAAIGPVVDRSASLERDEAGRSAEGRPIHVVRYGAGPTRVLLWSQMHGDESTATMALADIIGFLAAEPEHPLARRLAEGLTIELVPMLNPDGAERFQRRNAYGVDVNRDARALATPEARTLKAIQERFRPEFGFNLHDQNVRTRVGSSDRLAAIALLAPAFDLQRSDNRVRDRAKRVASVFRATVEPSVAGHISRYDDSFNPRAFGDLMQSWGVSTVLVESGGWRDDPEKQYLRRVNFVGLLGTLDAIATGAYAGADPDAYESLPENGSPVDDLLIRGGRLAIEGLEPVRVDISVDYRDALGRTGGRVVEVGDLADVDARDTLDATGLYVHPAAEALDVASGRPVLGPGAPATFFIREGPDPSSAARWVVREGVPERAPASGAGIPPSDR